MQRIIEQQDEWLHPAANLPHWQESFYFNVVDPAAELLLVARISVRPDGRGDGLVFALHRGRPVLLYPAIGVRVGVYAERGLVLAARGLRFTMLEPLVHWRLQLAGAGADVALDWRALHPAVDYHDSEGEGLAGIAAHHFEQSGVARGALRLGGATIGVNGLGQRDKSWGARAWSEIAGWDWINAFFGARLSVNLFRGPGPRAPIPCGYVHRDGATTPIFSAEVAYSRGGVKAPRFRQVQVTAHPADGEELILRGTPVGRFPLAYRGLWLEEVHARWVLEGRRARKSGEPAQACSAPHPDIYPASGARRDGEGLGPVRAPAVPEGERAPLQGYGVVERAVHVGVGGTVRRLPDLLATGIQAVLKGGRGW
ncbi:MAG: hypothetical protein HYV63_16235 [Candidatus Schekmanbacteria bacterium]|nr:hypothetical protein [Candidatus Schekmanbacteria bacterium]